MEAELGLRELDGTQAADDVGEDLLGVAALRLSVPGAEGHVIIVVREQNEVVALHVRRFDDAGVKGTDRLVILQTGLAQRH